MHCCTRQAEAASQHVGKMHTPAVAWSNKDQPHVLSHLSKAVRTGPLCHSSAHLLHVALGSFVFDYRKLRIEGFSVKHAGKVAVLQEVDRVKVAQARPNDLRCKGARAVAAQYAAC